MISLIKRDIQKYRNNISLIHNRKPLSSKTFCFDIIYTLYWIFKRTVLRIK